jgi:predicted DCC family thiol-disulfide oxidoreductase YuxK
MTDSPAQAPVDATGAHLVLYDGVCGLCSRLLQFLSDMITALFSISLHSKVPWEER